VQRAGVFLEAGVVSGVIEFGIFILGDQQGGGEDGDVGIVGVA
jgi:hypothetical protein